MNQTKVINLLLMLSIILLILKLFFYKHEPFNSPILDCEKYNYLCDEKQQTQNTSEYLDRRPEYLNNLDKISPRYTISSRYNFTNKNNKNNKNKTSDKLIFTPNRFFDPQA